MAQRKQRFRFTKGNVPGRKQKPRLNRTQYGMGLSGNGGGNSTMAVPQPPGGWCCGQPNESFHCCPKMTNQTRGQGGGYGGGGMSELWTPTQFMNGLGLTYNGPGGNNDLVFGDGWAKVCCFLSSMVPGASGRCCDKVESARSNMNIGAPSSQLMQSPVHIISMLGIGGQVHPSWEALCCFLGSIIPNANAKCCNLMQPNPTAGTGTIYDSAGVGCCGTPQEAEWCCPSTTAPVYSSGAMGLSPSHWMVQASGMPFNEAVSLHEEMIMAVGPLPASFSQVYQVIQQATQPTEANVNRIYNLICRLAPAHCRWLRAQLGHLQNPMGLGPGGWFKLIIAIAAACWFFH